MCRRSRYEIKSQKLIRIPSKYNLLLYVTFKRNIFSMKFPSKLALNSVSSF